MSNHCLIMARKKYADVFDVEAVDVDADSSCDGKVLPVYLIERILIFY
jgi:hypothetical protein